MNSQKKRTGKASAEFITACQALIGIEHVLLNAADKAPFLTDWRKRYSGAALAVLCPQTSLEAAAIVDLCNKTSVAVVPQGGNTGLSGGATPNDSGQQVVISLRRLNRIREINLPNRTITAEAGCILQSVQDLATSHQRLFPLSLAAEGSCTIGGVLSTNAGGTAVLRYGSARELCLGLEVVTADGQIWDGLRGLRKDNTGYDLRDLFIGAEGSLGLITAAVLKLQPAPAATVTALAAVPSVESALALLNLSQRRAGMLLTAFELISHSCLDYVSHYFPQLRYPFDQATPYAVLLELSDQESEDHARAIFNKLMEESIANGLIDDALIAQSIAQTRQFWNLREHIPLAQVEEGPNIKHDVSLPASRIAEFVAKTDAQMHANFPGCRIINFGHLGDGNLHYNIACPVGTVPREFMAHQDVANRIVHDRVIAMGGSISAEHGIGKSKIVEMGRYKTAVELQLMYAVKKAFDPKNLMNPGKVLPRSLSGKIDR